MRKASLSMLRNCAQLLLAIALLAALVPRARAQALPAASKSVDLSVFGGFTHTLPDYGPSPNNGGTFGVDYTRYFRSPVVPSLEVRANVATGPVVRENTYLFGLKGQGTLLRHYHPYVDFLVGPGTLHYQVPFVPGYTGDNSIVYSVGGGLDWDFLRDFSAKIDYQYQFWKLGTNDTLTPSLTIIGVSYRIPFRAHDRQADYIR